MGSWRTVGGVDWLSVEAVGDAEVELGLVFDHGYAHERPADIGIGSAAVAVLTQQLARPVEAPDHRVVESSVLARVGLQETIIIIRGDRAAVRHGASLIEQLLAAPEELEGVGRGDPRRFAWIGWSSELAAWFGVGSVSLAAETSDPWVGEQERFVEFVRSLHPASGRRVVAWTDLPELVGTLFADPVSLPERPVSLPERPVLLPELKGRPLAWRDPSPILTAGSVGASYTDNLVTVRMPSSPLTDLALNILGQTVYRSLVVLTQLVQSLEVTREVVGTDELYALRAVAHAGTTDWVQVRSALIQALDAIAETLDPVLDEQLTAARESTMTPSAITRAVEAVRTDVRSDSIRPGAALESVTLDDVRRSLEQVQAAALVSVPSEELATPERPMLMPTDSMPVERPTLRRRSLIFVRLRDVLDRQLIRADASALQQTLSPKNKKTGPGARQRTTESVDLTRLVARVDRGAEYSTLIDEDDHRLTLIWPAYLRPAPLRRLVDGATPAGATIRRDADPVRVAQLRSDVRTAKMGVLVRTVLLLLALALIIWRPTTGVPKGPDQDPVVATVVIGDLITLGNGSTVQVSKPTWTTVATSTYPVLVVEARYCGGGVTVDRNTGDDARNYISPDRFELTGISAASRQTFIFSGLELKPTQLREGQCTQGKLGFDIDAEKPNGVVVSYHNGSGDALNWTLD